jgi:ATP-binding protein involved in chromosome partitioning
MRDQPADMTKVSSEAHAPLSEEDLRIRSRLADIRFTIAVISGKGGVGKTTLTANLAVALRASGSAVGIIDADVNVPSVCRMLGLTSSAPNVRADEMLPPRDERGILVMGLDPQRAGEQDPLRARAFPPRKVVRRGGAEVSALRSFLGDTAWGPLDYLLIDLPPGADRLPAVADLIPALSAVVVVSIPSYVGGLAVMRAVAMAEEVAAPIAGLIQNMAGYQCLSCGSVGPLFDQGSDARQLEEQAGLPLLARVPFDPRLARSVERGVPFVGTYPDAPAARALVQAAEGITAFLSKARTQASAAHRSEPEFPRRDGGAPGESPA